MRQCLGMNLAYWGEPFDLTWDDDPDRCPNPATCRYYVNECGHRIPLCAEHYDIWEGGFPDEPDESLPCLGDGPREGGCDHEWCESFREVWGWGRTYRAQKWGRETSV